MTEEGDRMDRVIGGGIRKIAGRLAVGAAIALIGAGGGAAVVQGSHGSAIERNTEDVAEIARKVEKLEHTTAGLTAGMELLIRFNVPPQAWPDELGGKRKEAP